MDAARCDIENLWLYKNVHKIHHESYNPDPFSGLSFHPIEGFIYFTSLLGTLIVPRMLLPLIPHASRSLFFPAPRWGYAAYRTLLMLAPISGHFGHGDKSFLDGYGFGGHEHWIHHAKFNYNFGSGLLPYGMVWDRLMGTLLLEVDDDEKATTEAQKRRRAAAKKQAQLAMGKGKAD